jgi:hypothetical protein
MKLLSSLFFAGGGVLLILTATQVLARGWGPLDVTVLDVYFVVLPRYLLVCFDFYTASLTSCRKSGP